MQPKPPECRKAAPVGTAFQNVHINNTPSEGKNQGGLPEGTIPESVHLARIFHRQGELFARRIEDLDDFERKQHAFALTSALNAATLQLARIAEALEKSSSEE
jgi:hypothetical protein